MAGITKPDEMLHFPKNMSIEINYKNTLTYSKCTTYDAKTMNQGYVWHQVIVEHKGKVRGMDGQRDILNAIFEAIGGEEFYPIAYRHGIREDKFLVRQCTPALDKLFKQNLRIQLSNAAFVPLQIQLNVGAFHFGQISPITKIQDALATLYQSLEFKNGLDGTLDLSKFNLNKELFDVVINMTNRGVFERICELIYRNDDKFRNIKGLMLNGNNITTLAPLKVFNGNVFSSLDLRDNELSSASRLCRDLKEIKADKLLLTGNPLLKLQSYPDCLKSILKNFKMIDGIPSENLSKDYTPMDYEVDVDCDGFRIDWTNKSELRKFQHSSDWHAVMIPDAEEEFSKEEIFDYFFITVSTELSDLYPCYYKFSTGEHQFLVRQCYDQLQHLVHNCNLEIKIPRIVTQDPELGTYLDAVPQVHVDQTLVYYLRMNISPFKKGQVDPVDNIEKALSRRFSPIDRLLNLESFHKIDGMENIIVNLSSIKILSRVLMQASRKFHSSCIELRLGNNKILSANLPKVLSLMSNLKAIDLGNNWIHDLYDIKELDKLGLKSLRLDGNPLCAKYSFPSEYIRAVKRHFPDLQKLDNVEITSKGYLNSRKNFLCDVKGYDFVEQFVTRYFSALDSPERSDLRDFYHSNALFTMTSNYVANKMTTQSFKRLSKYVDKSRNILKMSDLSRSSTTVHFGVDEISQVLLSLPKTEHDMLSFTTDTTVFDDKMVVITISGVFRDLAPTIIDTDVLMAFTRTFVLTSIQQKLGILQCATSYKIVNEQLNIFTPSSTQLKGAFKYAKTGNDKKKVEVTVADKEGLLIMLQQITNLKSIWCTRCLEDAKWDFQQALDVFVNLCQKNEVPDTAFI